MKKEELNVSNKCKIIIATYQMASEGYDNPDLDTLILASPKGNVEQAVGRILRKKNKNAALVIDINDSISIFNNWSKKRQMFYKSKKFTVRYINKDDDNIDNEESSDLKITECLI
jgi:superfamily II DNA or RNA helicase